MRVFERQCVREESRDHSSHLQHARRESRCRRLLHRHPELESLLHRRRQLVPKRHQQLDSLRHLRLAGGRAGKKTHRAVNIHKVRRSEREEGGRQMLKKKGYLLSWLREEGFEERTRQEDEPHAESLWSVRSQGPDLAQQIDVALQDRAPQRLAAALLDQLIKSLELAQVEASTRRRREEFLCLSEGDGDC